MNKEKIKQLIPAQKLYLSIPEVNDVEGDLHQPIYSQGIVALSKAIEEDGSLYSAARKQHMSYSKAWKLIKNAEAALGFELLVRDGTRGSALTEEGKYLLDTYVELDETMAAEANKFWAKKMKELSASKE